LYIFCQILLLFLIEKAQKILKHDFEFFLYNVAGLRVSDVLRFPRTRVLAVEVGISMLCVGLFCLMTQNFLRQ